MRQYAENNKSSGQNLSFYAVPNVGVEPTLPCENYALNVARLPIPPIRLECMAFYQTMNLCQWFFYHLRLTNDLFHGSAIML